MSRGDRWLLIVPLVLTALGVIMVFSSSAILGITRYQDPNHFFVRQALRALLGLLVLFATLKVPLKRIEQAAPWMLGAAALLLTVVAVVGHVSNGAMRWIRWGVLTLQPTEIARLSTVVFMAWWLKRHPPAELGFVRGLLPPALMAGGLAVLILLQPNLSSAALLLVVCYAMLFLGGARIRHLLAPAAAGTLIAAVALATHPYMMGRVNTYLDFALRGTLDQRGSGWQLDQSLIAIGSGGWHGRGLGAGLQKYLFLPEAHTDFIFSILAEELGFIGTTALLAAFALLLWRGMRAAARASEPFAFLLASGLTLQIGLYALVNLAVASGLSPTTGLPLPFVSYGGSALLINLAAAGLLYRVSAANGTDEALSRRRFAGEGA
jgi:cell division protein FtsW